MGPEDFYRFNAIYVLTAGLGAVTAKGLLDYGTSLLRWNR
jgi:hypothetical protein